MGKRKKGIARDSLIWGWRRLVLEDELKKGSSSNTACGQSITDCRKAVTGRVSVLSFAFCFFDWILILAMVTGSQRLQLVTMQIERCEVWYDPVHSHVLPEDETSKLSLAMMFSYTIARPEVSISVVDEQGQVRWKLSSIAMLAR